MTLHIRPSYPYWYVFRNDEILIQDNGEYILFPQVGDLEEIGLTPLRSRTLDLHEGSAIQWAEVGEETDPPEGMQFTSRRHVLDLVGEENFAPAGVAYHYMDWTRKTLFCSRCGNPMEDSPHEKARLCQRCGLIAYPTISPAIIVAVEREGKILLARSPRFPRGRYSVLAGFVEPGEALEDTVKREVMEEVSVEVGHIKYFASQPWPFPHSLMLGFTAEWKRGEIQIDGIEIEDAGWYGPDELPNTPSTRSISGHLIRNFLKKQQA